ncbi:isoleucine--tRNA ligase [Desertimonas flava]|uniref:isoleucine--tRNA ligase n=1 Tax=Desertimonas flava TaxID=2064846 RepID=UPI000E344A22|nr:isoleucine--tRNA ligase [Desertimonas flava]
MAYPDVDSQPNFPALETGVLERWERDKTFLESIIRREDEGAEEFVVYDGPPFANGLPHYGHLLTGFVKDAVPRYQTMRGKLVHRRFGWDCHGLPAEVEAEKELGIAGHPEITKFGIAEFNDACRTSVLRYTAEWERYVTRQARWVDFENDYKTLDDTYMESVMWAFKTLWDKGLVYEGFKVLAYCWRCETPLSNTETRMDDVYFDRQDPALTVGFDLLDDAGAPTGEALLAWTTTPWTLPANLGLAVAPDVDYVAVEHPASGKRVILAEDRLAHYAAELGPDETRPAPEIVARYTGAELAGRRYRPLFPYFADTERSGTGQAFQVLAADFVTTDDGTGIVHLAPGFGEDDQNVCNAAGIPTVVPMDEHGQYTAEVPDWTGVQVFEANPHVIRHLKEHALVLRHETYNHSYPHCWRCSKPLVYRAISSWFVAVTKFRDRMVELNDQINWVPSHVKHGSFGKWLQNARDWSISRNRFWGSPIPVWRSDNPEYPRTDVYGSFEQLEADFGVKVADLHRPMIDELVRPNPDDPTGQSMMRRVPEVLDCWFESGSMPFAQVHYPFENTEWFESHYPGDFIVEYIGQTRGWFYTLHVLATALFDRPAFRTCISHGIIQGDDGLKMSKSLRNYADPMEVFDTTGADAMRWYLLSSPILRGGDFAVTQAGLRETTRQVLLPLWNAWYFLTLYANAAGVQGVVRDGVERPFSMNVLDRYIIAKTRDLVDDVTRELDGYDLFEACAFVRSFVDSLTNWYIRRSRQRFWDGDRDAIDTLHTVMDVLSRVVAPLLPFVADEIYGGLHGGDTTDSVHLQGWPKVEDLPGDENLVRTMDEVRDVCSVTLSVRKANARRVRQPLSSLTVAAPDAEALRPFLDVIADEVNVREIHLVDDVSAVAKEVLQVVPAALGPRLGPATQQVIRAVREGQWTREGDAVVAGGHRLEPGEFVLTMQADDGGDGSTGSAALGSGSGVVVLNVEVTPELEIEGQARDLVRMIQQERRDRDLAVTDRIDLRIVADAPWANVVRTHQELIATETLAVSIDVDDSGTDTPAIDLTVAST